LIFGPVGGFLDRSFLFGRINFFSKSTGINNKELFNPSEINLWNFTGDLTGIIFDKAYFFSRIS
jgi:hypothetical protein